LNAQVQITQAFDQERHKIKVELNKDEQDLRDAAKAAEAVGDTKARDEYFVQADKVQQKALIFDGISSALYGPNSNGAVGYVAKAVSPQISYKIGQAFKENDYINRENNNTELTGEGSPKHLLAHTILGAAVSYATGNDALTGGNCWACYSHSSYYVEIPSQHLVNSQGQYIYNAGRVVPENQKVGNPNFEKFLDIWGEPKDNINPSIPVLVKPKNSQLKGVYDESAY